MRALKIPACQLIKDKRMSSFSQETPQRNTSVSQENKYIVTRIPNFPKILEFASQLHLNISGKDTHFQQNT